MFFRAKLAHAYGWTHHYIENLEYDVALEYYEAITPIEAQLSLVQMSIEDYPHLKRDGRSKMYKDMRGLAYPKGLQKEMSFEDFAKKMGMNGGRKS